jgi:hypothetical protein
MLPGAGEYRLIKKIPIPGDYGWDYLTADSEGRRLYFSHDRDVVVLDLDSGAIIGKIPGKSVHGITIARNLGRGFISSSGPRLSSHLDLKTLAVISEVEVGADPNAILFDPRHSEYSLPTAAASASPQSTRRPAKSLARLRGWAMT